MEVAMTCEFTGPHQMTVIWPKLKESKFKLVLCSKFSWFIKKKKPVLQMQNVQPFLGFGQNFEGLNVSQELSC